MMPLSKKRMAFAYAFFFSAIILLFQGCPPQRPEAPTLTPSVMTRLPSERYPDFMDDMAFDGIGHAIDQSLSYLKKIPEDRRFTFGPDQFTSNQLIRALSHFKAFIASNPPHADLNTYIRANYWVYEAAGSDTSGEVLFTGYYEPNLRGSRLQTERYQYPVYARPENLIPIDLSLFSPEYKGKTLIGRIAGDKIVPYDDRTAIEGGSLEGIAIPLAWVDDPVDLFFLQIQGSGKIYLNTGEVLNVHYHISNGKPYRSIGKLLIEQNKIPKSDISMQTIRSYLKAHPEELSDIFSYNPSYVFFKTEIDGPIGCLDVKLTPGRSLAVDRRIFPMPTLSFIQTKRPLTDGAGAITAWTDCARFVLNQDTGGAIRGPGRADLFWGNGAYAELAAGHMQHSGRLYFLVLKSDAP
ncbi:MAG: MltA domain-containing protein [Desulfobacterales bacterium]|jgi:membrane-bound lytic murein transglycosylase A|nr:MltA domain-containing protein [Desulfobacterales bacterium]